MTPRVRHDRRHDRSNRRRRRSCAGSALSTVFSVHVFPGLSCGAQPLHAAARRGFFARRDSRRHAAGRSMLQADADRVTPEKLACAGDHQLCAGSASIRAAQTSARASDVATRSGCEHGRHANRMASIRIAKARPGSGVIIRPALRKRLDVGEDRRENGIECEFDRREASPGDRSASGTGTVEL
jgi:hypothetical protein